jgi:hypothetical protein
MVSYGSIPAANKFTTNMPIRKKKKERFTQDTPANRVELQYLHCLNLIFM